MSRPRRQQPKKPINAAPDWSPVGMCPACGKKIYPNKKAAKNAARIKHPDDQMSAYQCRSTSPKRPNPAPWHFGHLDENIKNGSQTRIDRYVFATDKFSPDEECPYVDKKTGLKCSLPPDHGQQPHLAKTVVGDWININPEQKRVTHIVTEMNRIHRASLQR